MDPRDDAAPEGRSATAVLDGPGRVEVVGGLHEAVFPGECVRCGADAAGTLPVTKLFWHASSEGSSHHFAAGVNAPFCAACIEAHRREARPLDPEVRSRLLRRWAAAALPYVLPLGINLWLLTIFVPNLLGGADLVEMLIWGGVSALFGGLAWMFYRRIRNAGGALILEPAGGAHEPYAQVHPGPLGSRFVVPGEPTSAQRALDFTDDQSEAFEPERHRFTFENGAVATRFMELNAARQWKPGGPRALAARYARRAVLAAIVLAVLYQLLADLFS